MTIKAKLPTKQINNIALVLNAMQEEEEIE